MPSAVVGAPSWLTLVSALAAVGLALGDAPAVLQTSTDLELVVNIGHGVPIRQVAFTHDGRELLSVADDGTLRIWDTARASLLRAIPAHSQTASALAVSPDDALAATGGDDKRVRIWSLDSGALVAEAGFDARVAQVAWDVHPGRLAVAAGTEVGILQEAGGRWDSRRFAMPRSVDAVGIAGPHLLAAVGEDLLVYDLEDLSRQRQRLPLGDTCRRLVTSGTTVGALLHDGVKLFDVGSTVTGQDHAADRTTYEDMALSERLMVLVTQDRAQLWDRTTRAGTSLDAQNQLISAVALDHAGSSLALGTLNGDVRVLALQGDGSNRVLPASSLAIGDVSLDGQALRIVTLDATGVSATALAPEETTVRFGGSMVRPRTARWLPRKGHVVAAAPLRILSWNTSRVALPAQFEGAIDAWPLSCTPDGICAWEESAGDGHA